MPRKFKHSKPSLDFWACNGCLKTFTKLKNAQRCEKSHQSGVCKKCGMPTVTVYGRCDSCGARNF